MAIKKTTIKCTNCGTKILVDAPMLAHYKRLLPLVKALGRRHDRETAEERDDRLTRVALAIRALDSAYSAIQAIKHPFRLGGL